MQNRKSTQKSQYHKTNTYLSIQKNWKRKWKIEDEDGKIAKNISST